MLLGEIRALQSSVAEVVKDISKDHITFISIVKCTSSRNVFPEAYLLLVATSHSTRLEFYCVVLNNNVVFLECGWRSLLFSVLMRLYVLSCIILCDNFRCG